MARDIECCGVGDILKSTLAPLFQRGVAGRNGRGFHRGCWRQQQVVRSKHFVELIAQLPRQVLRFGVIAPARVLEVILADQHGDLERIAQLIRAGSPFGMMLQQLIIIKPLPACAHAVAQHHLLGQSF